MQNYISYVIEKGNIVLKNKDNKSSCLLSFNLLDNTKEEKVLKAYLELASLYNWDIIDCIDNNKEKSIETIHQEIIKLLKNKGIF